MTDDRRQISEPTSAICRPSSEQTGYTFIEEPVSDEVNRILRAMFLLLILGASMKTEIYNATGKATLLL